MSKQELLEKIKEQINSNTGIVVFSDYTEYSLLQAIRDSNDILCNIRKMLEEDTESEESYNRGLNDAWKLARKLGCLERDGGWDYGMLIRIFSNDSPALILTKYSVQEALAKVEAYEKKKAEEEAAKKLVAGDVVEFGVYMDRTAIFLYENFGDYWVLVEAGECPQRLSKEHFTLKKTGKHVDLEGLFAGIKEE